MTHLREYRSNLKPLSRNLRNSLTEPEVIIWHAVRRKQIYSVQFYRQKPLLNYIVDFYAPSIKLIIEIDGSQHFTDNAKKQDQLRSAALTALGLETVRFNNFEVLREREAVLQAIWNAIEKRISIEPCHPA